MSMEKVFGDEKRGKRKEAGNRTNVRGGRKRPGLSRLLESFDRTSSTKLRKRMETTEKRQARTEEKGPRRKRTKMKLIIMMLFTEFTDS